MRGNPDIVGLMSSSKRSIPAGAGEPLVGSDSDLYARVYPRGCGGTNIYRLGPVGSHGLSPRVRGNRGPVFHKRLGRGSIPAGAGEPQWPLC